LTTIKRPANPVQDTPQTHHTWKQPQWYS
jgi:hypothetical protein